VYKFGKVSGLRRQKCCSRIVDLWVLRASCSIRDFFGCEGSLWICFPSGADPLSRTCVVGVAQFLNGFGAEESSHVMLSSCFCTSALQRNISCASQALRKPLSSFLWPLFLVSYLFYAIFQMPSASGTCLSREPFPQG
jgi:hypothetical protein